MSPGLAAFIVVVIFIVGWFAVGTHYNVRKGHAVMRWLQDGLPLVGEKTTLRWLGSSVVELKIQQAKPPFRQAEILLVLAPRDVALLWGLARLRRRNDLFIFRGILRKPPRVELEALDNTAWSNRGVENQVKDHDWTSLPVSPPLVAYSHGALPAVSEFLDRTVLDGCPLQRLAIRHSEPHVELRWPLDPLCKHSARTVFETVLRTTESL